MKTGIGRIDAVVKTSQCIVIFEFKLNNSAENAMQQIRDKRYAAAYRSDPRKKVLVGVAFSSKDRTISEWLVEEA